MFVNSKHKAIQITGQRKAFYRQKIPESSCARKETVDIEILATSRNGDRNHGIYQNNEYTSLENKEVLPGEPVQMNTYHTNAYKKT